LYERSGRKNARRVVPLRITFDSAGCAPGTEPAAPAAEPQSHGFPPMSITQDEENLYLRAEVTGIEPAALSIFADWKGVSLAGKRRLVFFDCTIALPAEVDAERADAGYCNGILTLTLPKAGERKLPPS
jgi:HSP20 family molecular chaperone IbpA